MNYWERKKPNETTTYYFFFFFFFFFFLFFKDINTVFERTIQLFFFFCHLFSTDNTNIIFIKWLTITTFLLYKNLDTPTIYINSYLHYIILHILFVSSSKMLLLTFPKEHLPIFYNPKNLFWCEWTLYK